MPLQLREPPGRGPDAGGDDGGGSGGAETANTIDKSINQALQTTTSAEPFTLSPKPRM